MSREEAIFLKERALKFYKNGKDLFEKGVYDIAAFNFEQAVQLLLKYHLFKQIGDYPKTHYLKTLFSGLVEANKSRADEIDNFYKKNINVIANLENAYLTARYLPAEFTEEEVKNMAEFVDKFMEFFE